MSRLIWIQLAFLAINIAEAKLQAWLFDVKNKTVDHAAWAFQYIILVAIGGLYAHSTLLGIALIIQRMPVFNTSLNLFRHKPFFYTGTASVIDRLMGKFYPLVFWLSLAAIITLQYFIFRK